MSTNRDHFEFRTGVIGYPILFVLSIWIVFWVEIRFGFDFNHLGVYPRTTKGLIGVLCSPFIHGDMSHLWHNTIPILILNTALFFFYPKVAWKVLFIGTLGTGISTWILGRPSYHIGASGVIYMLFGFLFFKGILAKHFRLIAVSLLVVFVYGSMVWYILPGDPKVSWEGHLSGLAVGIILAFCIQKGIVAPKQYAWQSPDYDPSEDEFLKHFDENGNFIELQLEEEVPEINVVYEYKPNQDKIEPNETP